MKRLSITLCIFLSCCILKGQHKEYSKHGLIDKFNQLNTETSKAISSKDYINAEKHAFDFIDFFSTLSPQDKEKHTQSLANNYYQLACIYSLRNEKEKSIQSFEKAVELGFVNYTHANNDKDLDYIRSEQRFTSLMDKIKPLGDYEFILKSSGKYQSEKNIPNRPIFIYEEASSKPLQIVKEYFGLDSIAGNGGELSKIFNIMQWVHNSIPHTGNGWPVSELDAIDIYNYSKANNKALNCLALSIVLNECYLSMGFKSRIVACYPKNEDDFESHVINTVYSTTLNKWLWVDATFNAYLTDENGVLLSIAEVRERLRNDQPVNINKEANWNNTSWTKELYFDNYMTRFLYWFECPVNSAFNIESDYRDTDTQYISLMPEGYMRKKNSKNNYITTDARYFWQEPNTP